MFRTQKPLRKRNRLRVNVVFNDEPVGRPLETSSPQSDSVNWTWISWFLFWLVLGSILLVVAVKGNIKTPVPYRETEEGLAEHLTEVRRSAINHGRYRFGYIGNRSAECINEVVYVHRLGAYFLPGKSTPETCPWPP